MTMAVIEPLAVDRTRLMTYTLSDRDIQDEAVKKGRDFVTAGTAEDREMAEAIQRGLATGRTTCSRSACSKAAIRDFHRNLAQRR